MRRLIRRVTVSSLKYGAIKAIARLLPGMGSPAPVEVMCAGESGSSTADKGYFQDKNGRWHRPNGQFASNKEVSNLKNDYSGEEWCRYFRGKYGNNNVTWEDATPSQLARSWQGAGDYMGVDEYVDTPIHKGRILYRGEPNGTEYFTTLEAVEQSGRNATTLFEGLQVQAHPKFGYRGEMGGYLFNEEVAAAYGITNANPQFGKGGLPQYYVPDAQKLIDMGVLTPVDTITLQK